MSNTTAAPPRFITEPQSYDGKIIVQETPRLFHRLAPGFPMATRCGIEFQDSTRSTTHPLPDRDPCAVCFSWPNVNRSVR